MLIISNRLIFALFILGVIGDGNGTSEEEEKRGQSVEDGKWYVGEVRAAQRHDNR
ncbi:hypothetical protein LguiA_002029 [Lonicera macranthoides]